VLRQLQGRARPAGRRPLLAVGGALYEGASPSAEGPLLAGTRGAGRRGDTTTTGAGPAAGLYRSAERRIERGRSPRPTYARLGYDRWPPLYGTELEVQKLRRAVGPGTDLLTGRAASEERIRRMSASGRLAGYRWLHFATHGLAVPEAPSLSALVLSQAGASDSLAARDGYLTMREIASLRLGADVAVLSACRTGLGRIVAGEGVVSLSHAFMRAGANATLVSQWRVLDWSTQQFMTAVYRRARADTTTFAEATAEVKRAFVEGQFGARNTDPLRWAPFVYYGRE
jgi:CHAT domain-containing protein